MASVPKASTGGEVSQHEDVAGEDKSIKSRVLGAATGVVQSFTPIKQIHQHVCGLHAYAHDISRQVIAHHYCTHYTEELHQCVIYDSDKANARLIGIEYIISRRLFEGLPEEEKKLWHAHDFEVMSGMLVAPRVPEAAETIKMQDLVDTYGKTWHTWQFDRGDALPLGPPQLMMSFTDDSQVDWKLIEERDQEYGIDYQERRKTREKNVKPPKSRAPGCDSWLSGKVPQVELVEQSVRLPQAKDHLDV